MTRQEYILKKIDLLNETMVSYHRWSVILFIVAIISIGISFITSLDKSISSEFIKYGLSSISTLSGAVLQGIRFIRKNKIIELEFCVNLVNDYENLQEFDKKIINKALDGIFND